MTEATAIEADAQQRMSEIREAIARLWADRSEPEVLSELHALVGELRQAKRALR